MKHNCHTPGPWKAEDDENTGHAVVLDEQEVTVARVYQQPYDPWYALDNARLIAAAPDLYDALRNLCESVECEPSTPEGRRNLLSAVEAGYAALAKAEGGKQ